MKILVDLKSESAERWLPPMRAALPGHEIVWWDRGGNNADVLDGADAALVWHPDPAILSGLASAIALFSMGAGVDHVIGLPDLPPDVPIVRFVDPDLTDRMSEWIVLQCLMHLRQQRRYDALQDDCRWRPLRQPIASELRVGILGLGTLGQDAAKKLQILGFKLAGWSRSAKTVAGIDSYAGTEELNSFLAATDILVSLLPYTSGTAGFVDRSVIDRLARCEVLGGPVYINAGRGGTQVERDIVAALEEGRLSGVSLDVFETEPLPADSPLWGFSNAILTPHVAAWSSHEAVSKYVARQVGRYERGEPFENVIDRSVGY